MFLLPFHVISCAHDANAADVVGRVRFSAEEAAEVLQECRSREVPAVLLSTCHRTELYWWGDESAGDRFATRVQARTSHALHLVQADADLAVRHLFAVSSGMRSVRFGEPEILGQVRRAWTHARTWGATNGAIDATFRAAVDAARHVRAAMGPNPQLTLGERVVELLGPFGAHTPDPQQATSPGQILVVGTGDAARGVLTALTALRARHAVRVSITGRTPARVDALCREFTGEPTPWHAHADAIAAANAVVFAVHVTAPLVTTELLAGLTAPGTVGERPTTWVDLGVPPAVAPEAVPAHVTLVTLAMLEHAHDSLAGEQRALEHQRHRRASSALQHELARHAMATHRHQLGVRLHTLEAEAVAMASAERRGAGVEEVARKVARFVLRELSRA